MDIQPGQPFLPGIPTSSASPAPSHRSRPRRRSSVPAVPTDGRKKRPSNYIRSQTTSPEVISSLIDSLSAITPAAHNHFETLPVSSPASPLQSQFAESAAIRNGDAVDHPAFYQSLVANAYQFPDDACEPPVVRTSKPPSGLSPLTAPKKKDKDNTLKSYMSRGAGSSASVHSAHSGVSVNSFGAISIEAGLPRKPSNESSRWSSDSKRSSRGHKSLMFMSSREQLRVKEAERERKRQTIQGPEVLIKASEPARKTSSQLPVSEDTISEEPPVVAESSRSAHSRSSRGTSPLGNRLRIAQGNEGEPPVVDELIPQRGSSLKHSASPSRKGKTSHGRRSSRHDSHKTKTVPEEDESIEQATSPKEKILKELEAEEDEVAQRIRELKKQKQLRDTVSGRLPAKVDAGAAPSGARVSPIASPLPSPTSPVSTSSETRRNPTKAHRVLGITVPPPPEAQASHSQEPEHMRQNHGPPRRPMHTRARSLTVNDVNDSDDATPLPINYRLALQTLAGEPLTEPSSPLRSSATSSRVALSIHSQVSLGRSKSAVVGGRPAANRRNSSSMVMGKSLHKYSTSVTGGTESERSFRSSSMSEETMPRKELIDPSVPPSASANPLRRQTLKKKRWSHPDLPLRTDKSQNNKANASNAVQPPPQPVIEERPASVDSIDMDVEAYLTSPRLSQKIRHPQTGRTISFSEVGDPRGFAVFVCVGMGLTRFVMAFYDQLAATLKLRLITPDRPGVGSSQVDPNGTPLSWPDDVLVICQALKITKFSLLAHSAGAIYALATSLRMPQHIRGRVHLLAPWIPPSQMAPIGLSQDQPPQTQLPRSQRFLRTLPPSLLKIANSTFLSATSASLQRTGPKNSPKTKRRSVAPPPAPPKQAQPVARDTKRDSMLLMDQVLPNTSSLSLGAKNPNDPNHEQDREMQEAMTMAELERRREFDERLTFAIWDRATAGANPATDLIVCLETKQTIGFRYEDINRAVVIHHGSKDSRVPVDNVRWLGRLMRKCEVRILDGEQHGLMASAQVMGNVLTEIAADWEDWNAIVSGKTEKDRSVSRRRTHEKLRFG